MQIFQASPELARVAQAIIACGMAQHLIDRAADLHDETAVTVALAQGGFGIESIRALRCTAVSMARQIAAGKSKAN